MLFRFLLTPLCDKTQKNIVSSEGEKKTKSKNDISNNGNVYYDDDDDDDVVLLVDEWMRGVHGGIEK